MQFFRYLWKETILFESLNQFWVSGAYCENMENFTLLFLHPLSAKD